MNQWHQPSPYLNLCHYYCLSKFIDTIYIKNSRVSSKVFQFFKIRSNLLAKYEHCSEAEDFILNLSCDLTKEQLIRYVILIKIMVLRRNSRKNLLASSRLLRCFRVCKHPQSHAPSNNKKSEIQYIYKIVLFVIAYVVYSNVIARLSLSPCASIIMKIFAELGRLCWHEPRRVNVRVVRLWRVSDLLVWNSADRTCKGKWLLNIS